MSKITVATTFSGIGAFEQALKKLKIPHDIAFAGDIDNFVKRSYFANYDIDESRWHNDITKFNAIKFKKYFEGLKKRRSPLFLIE